MTAYVKKVLIPIHILVGIAFALLLMRLASPQWLFLTAFAWFLFGCLGIEIGFHRLLSHKAFRARPFWVKTLSILGCYGGQWAPIQFVALHNGYHHPYADKERDVHSPTKGIWNSYLGWYFHVKEDEVSVAAARDLIRDPFQKFLQKNYVKIIWLPMIASGFLNFRFLLFGFALPMFLTINQANLSNTLGHLRKAGYRNYETPDDSVNIAWLAPFTFGLALHNNHHGDPVHYNFSRRFWEIDISAWIIPWLGETLKGREDGGTDARKPLQVRI